MSLSDKDPLPLDPETTASPTLSKWPGWVKGVALVACVYLFILGIGEMGHAFKLFGKGFSDQILKSTASPFVGLFIGIIATALVQSSSTTTSIIVTMVASGALTIEGAIPMVMGANIGTTITNMLVSVGHITRANEFRRAFAAATVHDFFNLIAVAVLFPIELATGFLAKLSTAMAGGFQNLGGIKLGNPLKAMTEPIYKGIAKHVFSDHPIPVLILGVLLTFLMLYCIVKLLRSMVLQKVEKLFDEYIFRNAALAMVFGVLLTIAVQSSSITTSLVVPLAAAGILRITQIFPYTLGANIGTTMTAIIAALATTSTASITVAFAHLLFNVAGIALIWPIPAIRALPVKGALWLADLSLKNRLLPVIFIPIIFFVIPLILIFIFK